MIRQQAVTRVSSRKKERQTDRQRDRIKAKWCHLTAFLIINNIMLIGTCLHSIAKFDIPVYCNSAIVAVSWIH